MREFLLFGLSGERFALELARIHEILRPPWLTPVPRAGSNIMGVCSVRGLLVTVVDLRKRLRIPAGPHSRTSRVLLTKTKAGEVIGMFVDEVHHVVRLEGSEIEAAESVLGGDAPNHVLGIGRTGAEVIVVLDLEGLVS